MNSNGNICSRTYIHKDRSDWFMLQALQHSGNWTHGMGVMFGSRFEYLYLLRNLQITSQFLYHPNLPYSCPSTLVPVSTTPRCFLLQRCMYMTDCHRWCRWQLPGCQLFDTDLSCSWCWSDWKLEMPGPERDYFFSFLSLNGTWLFGWLGFIGKQAFSPA